MNLREYITQLKEADELKVVAARIAPDLELAALCRREFQSPGGGSALLFENIAGSHFSAAANLFGSEKRAAVLLHSSSLQQFNARLAAPFSTRVGSAAERLKKFCTTAPPVVKNTETRHPDLRMTTLPGVRSWPQEGGRYLNLALALTHHPETQERNLGLYRVQILDDRQLAINFSPDSGAGRHAAIAREMAQPLPICLLLGVDPALLWIAAAPLPAGCDELQFYGALFDEKVRLVPAVSQPLHYIAGTEFVIEGEILPDKVVTEGPYGNHTGRYVTRDDCPVIAVTAAHHTDNAVIPLTVVGPPPSEIIYLGIANEMLIRTLIKIDYPQVSDVWLPRETMFHGAAVLAVKNQTAATHKDLIHELWKSSPLSRSRLIMLVDENFHCRDISTVWWRLVNGLKPQQIYVDRGRTAIDATTNTAGELVAENSQITELLQRRRDQYQLW